MRPSRFPCTFVMLSFAMSQSELQARTWLVDNFIANGSGCALGQGTEVSTQLDSLEIIMRDMQIFLPSFQGLPFAERKFCAFSLSIESVMNHYPTKFTQSLTFGTLKTESASAVAIAQSSVGEISLPPLEALLPAGTEIDEESKKIEFSIDLMAGFIDAHTWCTNSHGTGQFSSRVVVQGTRASDADTLIVGQSGPRQPLKFSAQVEWLPCSAPSGASMLETKPSPQEPRPQKR